MCIIIVVAYSESFDNMYIQIMHLQNNALLLVNRKTV